MHYKIAEATGNSAAAQYIGNMTVPRAITRRAATDPDTTISDVYEEVKARLRFRGNLTTEAAERRSAIQGFIDSQANNAAYTIRQLEKTKQDLQGCGHCEPAGSENLAASKL